MSDDFMYNNLSPEILFLSENNLKILSISLPGLYLISGVVTIACNRLNIFSNGITEIDSVLYLHRINFIPLSIYCNLSGSAL